MAEAFAHHLAFELVEASSAGLYPALIIQPETVQVLAERNIELVPRSPRSIFFIDPAGIDLLVNMSGAPVAPILKGFSGREIPWRIRDPIGQPIEIYRQVRDEIEQKVRELIKELRNHS